MKEKMPRTPFSTGLSRSARETELRIKHIMSGPRKRPPLPFLLLMFSICIFCGNLVSCQMAGPEPGDVSDPAGVQHEEHTPAVKGSTVPQLERRSGTYTFLLTANTGPGHNTDAFMVLCYDTRQQTAGLVSIPRDTLVQGEDRPVRLSTLQAGPEQQAAALSPMLGIPIDYFIDVDMDGFAALVDKLGGIDFYIPCDMDYDDPVQDLSIHFSQGPAHLNGQQVIEVARFRKNNDGSSYSDLGRVQTQQRLMEALAQKLLSWDGAAAFVDTLVQNVDTDLSAADMLYFASRAPGLDPSGGLETATLPLRGASMEGNRILGEEPDPEPALEVVNRLLNPYTQDMTLEDTGLAGLSG